MELGLSSCSIGAEAVHLEARHTRTHAHTWRQERWHAPNNPPISKEVADNHLLALVVLHADVSLASSSLSIDLQAWTYLDNMLLGTTP